MNRVNQIISNIRLQLLTSTLLRSVLVGIALYFLLYVFTKSMIWSGCLAIFGGIITAYLLGVLSNYKTKAILWLHQNVDQSEYSLNLLEKTNPNFAEQLQLERLSDSFEEKPTQFLWLKGSLPYFIALVFSMALFWFLPKTATEEITQKTLIENVVAIVKPKPKLPEFKSAKVKIISPTYTGIAISESSDLNLSAIVGSTLQWNVKFSTSEKLKVTIVNQLGQELNFKKSGQTYTYSDKVINSGLYGIKGYVNDSLVYQSDFCQLVALPDLAPRIEPDTKELYKFHFLNDSKTLNIGAKVSDDFLVKKVYVVATLARGSGESVKFREVQFPINKANFKSSQVTKTIDLKSLGFSPGDELYYYWAALDNKTPEPNFTKSDTYFVVYKDTAANNDGELATMAMNILPEYFRSQRQIIIDTEKLIAKRNKTAKQAFNSASNEIGFDQKSLRIRYGQYLGEEYETSIGGHAEGNSDNPLEGFTHDHDTDEEHAEIPAAAHSHPEKAASNDPVADLIADYVHSHDDAETNTFYEQSTRSLLKASLEQMWQAELHLRLYEPEKALPYENKALELLKEAQQKARTYVSKTSYDPPPIKEGENRMKGELKKFNANFKGNRDFSKVQTAQLAGEVLGFLELKQTLNAIQKSKIMALSTQLSPAFGSSNAENWKTVGLLRKLLNEQKLSKEESIKLKSSLKGYASLKKEAESPWIINNKKLENAYWKNLH